MRIQCIFIKMKKKIVDDDYINFYIWGSLFGLVASGLLAVVILCVKELLI